MSPQKFPTQKHPPAKVNPSSPFGGLNGILNESIGVRVSQSIRYSHPPSGTPSLRSHKSPNAKVKSSDQVEEDPRGSQKESTGLNKVSSIIKCHLSDGGSDLVVKINVSGVIVIPEYLIPLSKLLVRSVIKSG